MMKINTVSEGVDKPSSVDQEKSPEKVPEGDYQETSSSSKTMKYIALGLVLILLCEYFAFL